jgi:hypothetical protein
LIGLFAGAGAGYFWASQFRGPAAIVSTEQAGFRRSVESFTPSCVQLGREGLHGPVSWRGAQVYVQTLPDYYYVIALRTFADQPPATWWWGAGRIAARDQACGHASGPASP